MPETHIFSFHSHSNINKSGICICDMYLYDRGQRKHVGEFLFVYLMMNQRKILLCRTCKKYLFGQQNLLEALWREPKLVFLCFKYAFFCSIVKRCHVLCV